MNMDTRRGRLYGLTWPTGYFLRYDLAKRELKDLGPTSLEGENGKGATYRTICRSLAVDPRDGSVYFTDGDGAILRYRYDRDAIETVQGEDMKKDYFGLYDPDLARPHGLQLAAGRLASDRESRSTAYTAIRATCSASIRGPRRWTCWSGSPRCPRSAAACTTSSATATSASPWARPPHALLPHRRADLRGRQAAGRQGQHGQGRGQGVEDLHLVTYDIPTATYHDHGAIFYQDGRRPLYVNSIAVGNDGAVYTLGRMTAHGRTRTDLVRIPAEAVALPGPTHPPAIRVATFRCDVTPPLGQPMISCDPLSMVEQPLLAKGIVLEAGGHRYVLLCARLVRAVQWVARFAAEQDRRRRRHRAAHVAVQTVHQHTAPLVDMDAQKLLAEAGAANLQLDPKVFEAIQQRLAAAVKQSLGRLEPFDQIGTGQAKVDRVASSRRPVDAAGKIAVRYSHVPRSRCPRSARGNDRSLPENDYVGAGRKPLVRLHYYATHPQTSYGDGRAISDMAGDAREELERKEGVFQIYFNGCGGDITVGKYNDGSRQCRKELAERLLAGMEAADRRHQAGPRPGEVRWRTYPLVAAPADRPGLQPGDCLARMKDPTAAGRRDCMTGAERAAFHQRSRHGRSSSVPWRSATSRIVHLPGEPMIDFQLFAQGSSRTILWPWPDTATADRAISARERHFARAATSRPPRT